MVGDGTAGVIAISVGVGGTGVCVGSDASFEQLTDAIAKTDINMKIVNRLSNIRNPAPVEDHHLKIMIRELTNSELSFFNTGNFHDNLLLLARCKRGYCLKYKLWFKLLKPEWY